MQEALFVRHIGEGASPGLLLHCGLGVSAMWKGVAAELSDQLTMTVPDLPGHGRSPDFASEGDVHDQCMTALRPLVQDGVQLIGHSFGATVALRLAMEMPARIASLVLIEPVFFAAAAGRPTYAPHRNDEEEIFAVFDAGDRMETARRFNAIWGGGIPFNRFPEQVRTEMARQMDFVMGTKASLWDDAHQLLRPGGLEQLGCPVCMIRGGETVPIIADVHAGLMERIGDVQEIVIEGAGHMLVATHPKDVAAVIRTQLA